MFNSQLLLSHLTIIKVVIDQMGHHHGSPLNVHFTVTICKAGTVLNSKLKRVVVHYLSKLCTIHFWTEFTCNSIGINLIN